MATSEERVMKDRAGGMGRVKRLVCKFHQDCGDLDLSVERKGSEQISDITVEQIWTGLLNRSAIRMRFRERAETSLDLWLPDWAAGVMHLLSPRRGWKNRSEAIHEEIMAEKFPSVINEAQDKNKKIHTKGHHNKAVEKQREAPSKALGTKKKILSKEEL